MNDLITTTDPTMSSREIAELVESRHGHVLTSIQRLMSKSVINGYAATRYTHDQNGQEYYEYHINKRDSYIIVAQLSPEFTAKLVDRWQELEAQQVPKVPTTMAEALRLAADQAEELERQQAQIEAQKPAVEFVERHASAEGLTGLQQTGKLLKHPPRKFVGWLQDDEYLFRSGGSLTPYQRYIDQGLFEVIVIEKHGHARPQTMITPKGIQYFAKRFAPEITH